VSTIAHISDLHFGRIDERVCEGLLEEIAERAPALVAISGDLTQRARRVEFAAARAFIDRIAAPVLSVPGNHDVPLYDAVSRFARPLDRYRRYITPDLEPLHLDDRLAVLGINTARSLTVSGGRLSRLQIERARRRLAAVPGDRFKVVVTHHQFLAPPGDPSRGHVGGASRALEALEACGVEVLLAGHLHTSFAADARSIHRVRRSIVVVQAGTATSTRGRGEPNSYNLVTARGDDLSIVVREWNGSRFVDALRTDFVKSGHEWLKG
jgi:3',5'-cyclic AMP phosphodiesterase CpdA